ncbi:collagen alpha-1(I) chain-like [Bombina bombina]|uniref:collagen alpha-1(I) chain-like n=1 Tax=Bombina bombina TaxID=8345 RepID=UPI00235A5133|nr:collagen alpha-1(I) chain-like [Bombina bombina]XP_053562665.1 collagen alpha-1(I) chain-like [Bombina bombina]XP_053573128.1 collagen alpha-1(I) chain-like [Bombina bombina]
MSRSKRSAAVPIRFRESPGRSLRSAPVIEEEDEDVVPPTPEKTRPVSSALTPNVVVTNPPAPELAPAGPGTVMVAGQAGAVSAGPSGLDTALEAGLGALTASGMSPEAAAAIVGMFKALTAAVLPPVASRVEPGPTAPHYPPQLGRGPGDPHQAGPSMVNHPAGSLGPGTDASLVAQSVTGAGPAGPRPLTGPPLSLVAQSEPATTSAGSGCGLASAASISGRSGDTRDVTSGAAVVTRPEPGSERHIQRARKRPSRVLSTGEGGVSGRACSAARHSAIASNANRASPLQRGRGAQRGRLRGSSVSKQAYGRARSALLERQWYHRGGASSNYVPQTRVNAPTDGAQGESLGTITAGVQGGKGLVAAGAQNVHSVRERVVRESPYVAGPANEWSGDMNDERARGVPDRAGGSTSTPIGGGSQGGHTAGLDTPLSFVSPPQDMVPTPQRTEGPGTTGVGLSVQPAGGSVAAAPGTSTPSTSAVGVATGPSRIWIIGHSYVHWAALKAHSLPEGQQLGIPTSQASIRWLGRRGLQWDGLPALLQNARHRWGQPHIILLHMGGNDIGSAPALDLINAMRSDVKWICTTFPGVRLAWSNIIPRLRWRYFPTPRIAYRVRKKVNRELGRAVIEVGGFVVRHELISADKKGLYRPDGVHLSDEGLAIFLVDLKTALVSNI